MIATPSLQLWLRGETITAGVTHDSSGKGNNGAVSGAIVEAGKVGNCFKFDGVDDYVALPTYSFIGAADNSSFTFSAWIKLPVGTTPTFASMAILNNWQFICSDAIGIGVRNLNTGILAKFGAVPSKNVWNHVFIINDLGTLSVYVNLIPIIISTSIQQQIIGAPNSISSPISSVQFSGWMDEILLYNKSMNETDRKRIFCNMHPLNG